jgi:hypothetical protein
MEPETIPELLARLEREHAPCELCSKSSQYVPHCAANHGRHHETVPCDVARLVAHIRSMEATLTELADWPDGGNRYGQTHMKEFARAALGEAQ